MARPCMGNSGLLLILLSAVAIAVANAAASGYLPSPYFPSDPAFCTNGSAYTVPGEPPIFPFPSSPFKLTDLIFKKPFKNPPKVSPQHRSCRKDGHCMSHYDIDTMYVEADLGCPGPKTKFIAYGGTIPGASLVTPVGEEVHMRFTNKMFGPPQWPYPSTGVCGNETGRAPGIGMSVHNHGQASLAAYDGYAEDWICPGETKDYLFPADQAKFGWYHDHGLDITSLNAYHGLAGLFIPSTKKAVGQCGEPFNLDDVPDYQAILGDVVFDAKCQLEMLWQTVHYGHLFGDVNVISGVPWPVLTVHPTSVRIRLLSPGPARAWKLTFNTFENGQSKEISSKNCKVVASEQGFFNKPASFPVDGVYLGGGERYEVVCDFSKYAGKEIIVWNKPDRERQPVSTTVPFFCYSHLVMKINVLPGCPATCKFPSTPLLEKDGELVCGTKSAENACCPDGQFCYKPKDKSYRVCRSKPFVESGVPATSTCFLHKEAEPFKGGLRCGGKCFRDKSCSGKSQAEACCPDGHFCWFKSADNWMCRPHPKVAPKGAKIPAPPKTCSLPKADWSKTYKNKADDKILPADVRKKAQAMADAGKFTRDFSFGFQFINPDAPLKLTINGNDWKDEVLTPGDVGQNTWEVWKFYTDPKSVITSSFHPLHMHLVDFHVLRRQGYADSDPKALSGLEGYESAGPKDVVELYPNSTVYALVRFGPHRGTYMFHCHNTRHEDAGMMVSFKVIGGIQRKVSDGVVSMNKAANILYDTYGDPYAVPATTKPPKFEPKYLQTLVDQNLYRVFYPISGKKGPEAVLDTDVNIWKVDKYKKSHKC